MDLITPKEIQKKLVEIEKSVSVLPEIESRMKQLTANGSKSGKVPSDEPAPEHAHEDTCPGCKELKTSAMKRATEILAAAAEWDGAEVEAERLAGAYDAWKDAGFPAGKRTPAEVVPGLGV